MFDKSVLSPNINLKNYTSDQYEIYHSKYCKELPIDKPIIAVQAYMGTGKTSGMLAKNIEQLIAENEKFCYF